MRAYSKLLDELEEVRQRIAMGDQLNNMYQMVEEGVVGGTGDYKESRRGFEEAWKRVSFENRKFDLGRATSLS